MHCGASVRELYGAVAFHIHYLSHLHIYLIPRTSPPPTVACKTTGGEHLGDMLYRISNVSRCLWGNITCHGCANLGFVVHSLCHYCEMLHATRSQNIWRWLEELQG